MLPPDKPLFRPDALRPGLAGFAPPPAAGAKLTGWADRLSAGKLDAHKETELLPGFVADVFEGVLGYTRPPAAAYTLKREALVQVDGKFADAGLGRFGGDAGRFAAVLEGKGPRDPLDRPFAGRKRSAVEQALQYAVQLEIDWYLVTNLKETRLYHKGHDTRTFERFPTADLARDPATLTRFVYLLGADRVVPPGGGPNHLDALLGASKKVGRELTDGFYRDYRDLRERTFAALREHNPGRDPAGLLAATQKMLDRVLFIAFCEDRGLLPAGIITRAYQQNNDFSRRPVWDNFVGLFRAVDEGNDKLGVSRYNGGLFKTDPALDTLVVPDTVCEGFKTLAEYEYGADPAPAGKMIDVEILGHIFEQSISDLEALHRGLAGQPAAAVGKRKSEGAFYTPASVTRYIVEQTLGPVLLARFAALLARHRADAQGTAGRVLADPAAFDPDGLNDPQRKALARFWGAWLDELETVRVVDPACGSGAFLIEAFDQLFAEYARGQGHLTTLQGASLFDTKRTILLKNLFGVDLNGEAVEIARLSCWIKTAERGKELTSLDANIRRANSLLDDAMTPAAAWAGRFPDAHTAGGFDVVVGNPPYVRHEWIKSSKPGLEKHYKSYDGAADLYVYFYELGLNLLRPGGRLGYIVTNRWLKAGYGEKLRALYAEAAWVETLVDLGHNKEVFPDADVFPCILTARKPDGGPPPATARVCVLPRELTRLDDLSRQVAETGADVPRSRFTAAAWSLEPPGVAALMAKIAAGGVPLREFAGCAPLYGIKTGFNDAYLIDTPAKERLIAADPSTAPLFRPYLRGQDLERWYAPGAGLWMLALKSSGNHPWPWAGKPAAEAEPVFRATYPALFAHFEQYRPQLQKRTDQGEYWWELRACAYWDKFDGPKVLYTDITWQASYSFDTVGTLSNNTVYFLPTDDPWVLTVLNSPAAWWYSWRAAQHGKDEALRLFTAYMAGFPIPQPTPDARRVAAARVARLRVLAADAHQARVTVLDWLRLEFGVGKPSQKLAALADLSADGFAAEVRKLRGAKQPLSAADVKRLKGEHAASVVPLQALAAETARLERELSAVVNAAYGLTPAEVDLLWATAPPRMPTARPDGPPS